MTQAIELDSPQSDVPLELESTSEAPWGSSLQTEPTVATYFHTFNQGNFASTAALFSQTGELHPPFEEPVVGRDAILAYLNQEADGMTAYPKEMTVETLPNEPRQITVKGQVQALIFKVNVTWTFILNADNRIDLVKVTLLASLQELVHLLPGA